MSVKKRIKIFIKNEKLSVSAFEKSIDAANGFVNSISKSIGANKLLNINRVYPKINSEWLLTGEGKMLKTMQVVEVDPSTLVYMQVPLVGEYAQAGYLSGFEDDVYVEDLPKTTWNKEGKASDYLSLEVKGDSMDDGSWKSILEGDLLLCKNIPQDLWKSKLPINKWNFVLVHKTEGILVKQISEHNEKQGLLTLKSLNSYYPPLVVNINDIAKLFYITDCRRKLRL
tara:strand:- start:1947 stop:2627 length:681 start_codon:yes stop_codon:yes gene_type:complete